MKNSCGFFINLVLFLLLLFPSVVYSASSLSVSPSQGLAKTNCQFIGKIMLDTQGNKVDAAQVYLDHDFDGSSANFSFSGGGVFSSYNKPSNLPSGIDTGLIGYGNVVKGSKLKFGEFKLKTSNIKTGDIQIHFDQSKQKTSKVAFDGKNLLTSVSDGVVKVEQGYCESIEPRIVNLDPRHREPNHPVTNSIKFDLTDNSSGVNINTLQVQITHTGNTRNYSVNSSQINYSQKNSTDYSVELDPKNNFTPQRKVEVVVNIEDKAGNKTKRKYHFNDLTCKELGCSGSKVKTQCTDGKDNDNDGKIDLNDPGCKSKTDNNEYQPNQHACNDGVDNDGDGKVDFADPQCRTEKPTTKIKTKTVTTTDTKTVTTTVVDTITGETKVVTRTVSKVVTDTIKKIVTTTETITQTEKVTTTKKEDLPDCQDGVDNDGDKLVDYPEDPGCDGKEDNSEFDQASSQQLSISNLNFTINDNLRVTPNRARTIEVLSGANLTVGLDIENIDKNIQKARLKFGGTFYNMIYSSGEFYEQTISINKLQGVYNGFVRLAYSDGGFASVPFSVAVQPSGKVLGRNESEEMTGLKNAKLIVKKQTEDTYQKLKTITTGKNGTYSVFVPNGNYKLSVSKSGYRSDTTAAFEVKNRIINRKIRLVKDISLLNPNVSTQQKAQFIRDFSVKKVNETQELANSPQVEQQTKSKLAPAAAAATGLAVAPALGLLNLLNYLRFLFFQPLLLLGRKDREEWGTVYDALSRNPLDLVVVRLVDYDSDEVVQSRVTDSEGRYIFFAEPGTYKIRVEKDNYEFPSSVLSDVKEDGPYTDIYHGEPIRVEEDNVAVSPNIPLDPEQTETKETPDRIKWDRIKKSIQRNLARLGIAAGVVSLTISPSILVAVLLAAQIGAYYLFKRLGTTPQPENWGIVYEAEDEEPVKDVVVRLFTKDRNKLVSTGLTDRKGRYSFLVGPNDYYIRFDKEGYKSKSKEITIKEEEGVIEEQVTLEPKDEDNNSDDKTGDDLSFAE